jgi:hypothetical protein
VNSSKPQFIVILPLDESNNSEQSRHTYMFDIMHLPSLIR